MINITKKHTIDMLLSILRRGWDVVGSVLGAILTHPQIKPNFFSNNRKH